MDIKDGQPMAERKIFYGIESDSKRRALRKQRLIGLVDNVSQKMRNRDDFMSPQPLNNREIAGYLVTLSQDSLSLEQAEDMISAIRKKCPTLKSTDIQDASDVIGNMIEITRQIKEEKDRIESEQRYNQLYLQEKTCGEWDRDWEW